MKAKAKETQDEKEQARKEFWFGMRLGMGSAAAIGGVWIMAMAVVLPNPALLLSCGLSLLLTGVYCLARN